MNTASIRSLGLGLALAVCTVGVLASGKPLSISEKVELTASPEKAWDTIKAFDGWQNWHPAIASTAITKGKSNEKGAVRILTTKDGAKITETLMAYNPSGMTYEYRIDDSPLPVTGYVSTIKVNKTATGSTVVWSSTFRAKDGVSDDDAKKTMTGVYRAGLDNLAAATK